MTPLHYAVVALTLILTTLGLQSETTTPSHMNGQAEQVPYSVDPGDMVAGDSLINSIPKSELSDAEIADLEQMREEEKLARDVYLTLGETWNKPIFINIAASEETHTTAIKNLLDRYSLTDPALAERGEFTNPDLQKLYNDLVAEGKTSLQSAYTVGARIEDLDIQDLREAIGHTDNTDIKTVYENLERGSRNHLRAFNRQLVTLTGDNFTPEYMSKDEFTAIISSGIERGGDSGNSRGSGHGNSNGRGQGGGQ